MKEHTEGKLTMDKNMLKISLPDFKGPMTDLMNKLTGKESDLWWMAFKLFLRQQVTWHDFSDDLIKNCGLASFTSEIEVPRIFMVPALDPRLRVKHLGWTPPAGVPWYTMHVMSATGLFDWEIPEFVQVLQFIIHYPTVCRNEEFYALTSDSIFCHIRNDDKGVHLSIKSGLQGGLIFNGKPLALLSR